MADYTDDDLKLKIQSIASNIHDEINRATFLIRILKSRAKDNVSPALYEQETRFDLLNDVLSPIFDEYFGLDDENDDDKDENEDKDTEEKKKNQEFLKRLDSVSEPIRSSISKKL